MSKLVHIRTEAKRLGWAVSHCGRNLNLGSVAVTLVGAENDGRPICKVCKARYLALPCEPSGPQSDCPACGALSGVKSSTGRGHFYCATPACRVKAFMPPGAVKADHS